MCSFAASEPFTWCGARGRLVPLPVGGAPRPLRGGKSLDFAGTFLGTRLLRAVARGALGLAAIKSIMLGMRRNSSAARSTARRRWASVSSPGLSKLFGRMTRPWSHAKAASCAILSMLSTGPAKSAPVKRRTCATKRSRIAAPAFCPGAAAAPCAFAAAAGGASTGTGATGGRRTLDGRATGGRMMAPGRSSTRAPPPRFPVLAPTSTSARWSN